jgi:hypothetical protein
MSGGFWGHLFFYGLFDLALPILLYHLAASSPVKWVENTPSVWCGGESVKDSRSFLSTLLL